MPTASESELVVSDPDRLAEITASVRPSTMAIRVWVLTGCPPIDWLVGEVERLRKALDETSA